MLLVEIARLVEVLGVLLWVAALRTARTASSRGRVCAWLAWLVLLLLLPVGASMLARDVDFFPILHVLLLSAVNAFLSAMWALRARLPKQDLASFAVICAASAGMVVMFLLRAMTPIRMF
jgi:hypothetical protein